MERIELDPPEEREAYQTYEETDASYTHTLYVIGPNKFLTDICGAVGHEWSLMRSQFMSPRQATEQTVFCRRCSCEKEIKTCFK